MLYFYNEVAPALTAHERLQYAGDIFFAVELLFFSCDCFALKKIMMVLIIILFNDGLSIKTEMNNYYKLEIKLCTHKDFSCNPIAVHTDTYQVSSIINFILLYIYLYY